ncbi:MAG: DMT family transporter [Acutalibacteraceae bacterium]|nr:DMT family transporter [Acutalibacteraceae bacterium]
MDKKLLTKTSVIFTLCLLCCLLWGSAFPFIKIGYRLLNVADGDWASMILFAGLRFFIAGILTVVIGSFLQKKPLFPQKSNLFRVLKLSLTQTVAQYFFFYVGLSYTTGVKSSIINGASSFFSILIACFIFRQEKFTKFKFLGCVLGLFGIVLVNLDSSLLKLSLSFMGEGFMLLATLTSALSAVMIKEYSKFENPVTLSGYQFAVGGIIMCVAGLLLGGRLNLGGIGSVVLIVYLGLVSAVAYSLWGIMLKYNSVSKITVFGFMIPVFGFFLSAIILKEGYSINLLSFLSLVLVSAGIYVVNKFSR